MFSCAAFRAVEDTPRASVGQAFNDRLLLVLSQLTSAAMFTHDTTLRVRYGETDQMGYVYYGDYAEYLEVGRVEALRMLGFPYRRLEEEGVMLPVHELSVRYHQPARYDDELTVRTIIDHLPSVRIEFRYEIRNASGQLLTDASTTLVFVDKATMRPTRAPEALLAVLRPWL
jgi:acyl-CoA thioester hydrolase